jgi:hypothetical protein
MEDEWKNFIILKAKRETRFRRKSKGKDRRITKIWRRNKLIS